VCLTFDQVCVAAFLGGGLAVSVPLTH